MHVKLENLDEMESERRFYCRSCGKRLDSVDEISQRICFECKQKLAELKDDEMFYCWACGKQLLQISEVAQGLCNSCRASIIRKIHTPHKNINLKRLK
jgi:predicted RNA-binding Zn-ribbon protein involved in translation (DUF1610 family)